MLPPGPDSDGLANVVCTGHQRQEQSRPHQYPGQKLHRSRQAWQPREKNDQGQRLRDGLQLATTIGRHDPVFRNGCPQPRDSPFTDQDQHREIPWKLAQQAQGNEGRAGPRASRNP